MNLTHNQSIIEKIKKEMFKKNLLIVGETHGAAINIDVIKFLISKLNIPVIFIELEKKWNKYLKKFFKENLSDFKNEIIKNKWLIESGVFGTEHFKFWQSMEEKGNKIMAVKIENPNWNIAEHRTADNILKIMKTIKNKKFILVFGKLHARKNKFSINYNGKILNLVPLGFLLKKHCLSLQIRYVSGEAYNFGIKKINDKRAVKLLGDHKIILRKSTSKYFDYDFIVSKTKAISLIKVR